MCQQNSSPLPSETTPVSLATQPSSLDVDSLELKAWVQGDLGKRPMRTLGDLREVVEKMAKRSSRTAGLFEGVLVRAVDDRWYAARLKVLHDVVSPELARGAIEEPMSQRTEEDPRSATKGASHGSLDSLAIDRWFGWGSIQWDRSMRTLGDLRERVTKAARGSSRAARLFAGVIVRASDDRCYRIRLGTILEGANEVFVRKVIESKLRNLEAEAQELHRNLEAEVQALRRNVEEEVQGLHESREDYEKYLEELPRPPDAGESKPVG